MKRTFKKKLKLSKQTVRNMQADEMKQVAGAFTIWGLCSVLCTATMPKPGSNACNSKISYAANGGCECGDSKIAYCDPPKVQL